MSTLFKVLNRLSLWIRNQPVLAVASTFSVAIFLGVLITSLSKPKTPAKAVTNDSQSIVYQAIHSPDDIVALDSSFVRPVAYTQVVSLGGLEVNTKKQKFIDMLMPAILLSKQKIAAKHLRVLALSEQEESISDKDKAWLEAQYQAYKAKDSNDLLSKLQSHPNSIVLAQAAIETGWGTSRFFLEANNIFGVWSFNPKEPRIAASESRDGTTIYVKKYGSLIEAVDDYFLVIARGTPYSRFREARLTSQDPIALVGYLDKYSEIGDEYVKRLRTVIRYNNMQRYDDYQLGSLQQQAHQLSDRTQEALAHR
ncbi:MAG: glucosaminidase domain-containing protein [Pontibacterium sp.]